MDPGLVLLAGQRVWLSVGGRGSNIEPLTGVFRECGIVFDASVYNPLDANPVALAVVLPAGTDTDSSSTLSMPAEIFIANTSAPAGPLGVQASAIVYKTTLTNEVAQAKADSIVKCNTVVGVAINSAAACATSVVDRFGGLVVTAQSGVSIATGDVLYLSASIAGAVTNVAPSASGSAILVLGYAKQATAVPGGQLVMSWSPRTPTVNP